MRTQLNRRGVSLIQLTLLMPALLGLFLVTAAWIHQTMTFSSNIKKQQSQHQNLTRLASQFRRDVQRCESISMVNEQQICLQNRDLTETNYTVSEHAIQFWQNGADGQRMRHDQFDLASGSISKFDDTELPDWISLVISRLPAPNRMATRSRHSTGAAKYQIGQNLRRGIDYPFSTTLQSGSRGD